jgi:uncharacterized protein (TIGR02246 family)
MAMMVGVLALLVLPLVADAQGQGTRADEDAVRAMVARYVEAREARDGAAIGALFTADADQFTTGGEWRRGRDAVVTGALASSARTGGTRSITVRAVRFPTRDVAIADGAYDIAGTGGADTRRMWTTIVMTREVGGWRIASIRNASPTPIPE